MRFFTLGLLTLTAFATPTSAQEGDSGESSSGESEKVTPEQAAEARRKRMMLIRPTIEIKFGDKKVSIMHGPAKTEGRDYERIASLKPGEVVQFYEHQAIKLVTETDLDFGGTAIKAENVAPNYPGVYSLWIKKSKEGWRLAFNSKADVYGTQYYPDANSAEIDLKYEKLSEPGEKVKIELKEESGGAALIIDWGEHRWSVPFKASGEVASTGSIADEPEGIADARTARKAANPILYAEASIEAGKNAYLRECQRCHGRDGRALENIDFEATDLTNPEYWYYGKSDGALFASTKFGAGDDMPPFADKLSDEEIWHIVNFIRSIGPDDLKP